MEMKDDPLLQRLRALPQEPLDELKAERVRRRAQDALAAERRLGRWPWLPPLVRFGERGLLPLSLSAAVAVYLIWAVRFTSALYPASSGDGVALLGRALRLLVG